MLATLSIEILSQLGVKGPRSRLRVVERVEGEFSTIPFLVA